MEVVKPDYVIKRYTDATYGVVRFVRGFGEPSLFKTDKTLQQSNETKLENNYARARSMVKQYGLCNHWHWFFTGTLDRLKYDRHDLAGYKADLMQFVRDQRKKWGCAAKVLFVPEAHADGAWHMHGMIYDLPEAALVPFQRGIHPQKLVEAGYQNWPDYQRKFGFCSLARIKEPVGCALYLVKYVSKDVARRSGDLGSHLYMPSRPLKKAVDVADLYGSQPELDKHITYKGRFCSTGMVFDQDWSFPLDFVPEASIPDSFEGFRPLEPEPSFCPEHIDPFYEQVSMSGWK